jgi:hypothetical protein
MFAWLISHQPAVLFSHNKPATSNQPAVLFSQNKPAPAISHQPTEQAEDGFVSLKRHTRVPGSSPSTVRGMRSPTETPLENFENLRILGL